MVLEMMSDELVLIKNVEHENNMGDTVNVEGRTTILCSIESVTRSEYYAAAKHDMQPVIVFVVNKFDYDKQAEIEYEGEKYNVMRMYEPKGKNNQTLDIDRLELVCKGAD